MPRFAMLQEGRGEEYAKVCHAARGRSMPRIAMLRDGGEEFVKVCHAARGRQGGTCQSLPCCEIEGKQFVEVYHAARGERRGICQGMPRCEMEGRNVSEFIKLRQGGREGHAKVCHAARKGRVGIHQRIAVLRGGRGEMWTESFPCCARRRRISSELGARNTCVCVCVC
ncbi:hypothetical protein DUNSADRAFT_7827, partial [Dunaliella salina]